jgi:hypothetical protein
MSSYGRVEAFDELALDGLVDSLSLCSWLISHASTNNYLLLCPSNGDKIRRTLWKT